MGYQLTGDQSKLANKKIGDILSQLGQEEYPFDPERLLGALQALSEGRFEAVGGQFSSEPTVTEYGRADLGAVNEP